MLVSVAPAVVQLDASASEARPKPSTWLPESPMKTRALRPGRRLKGRKPRQAPPSASATTSGSSPASWSSAATAKTRTGDRGERRREAVHVVEQVERVRDPDEPDEPEHGREHVVAEDLDRQPGGEHDPRRRELGRQLGDRLQRVDVVGEAGDEEDRAAAEDPEQLAARVGRADRDGGAYPRDEAEEDADAAERGRRARVPALARGVGDEPSADAGAQEPPERQRRDRERGDRSDRVHGTEG